MKILVTGGAGFIGTHIVKLLLAENHTVTVYDNSKENLSRLNTVLSNSHVTPSNSSVTPSNSSVTPSNSYVTPSNSSVTPSNSSVTLSGAKGISSDLYSSAAPQNDNSLTLVEGDLKDQNLLEKSLEGIDAVIHMASLIEVSESVKFPLKFAENNILGSVYLLEAMKVKGVKKIIFSSSATVYGVPKSLPLTEDMPLDSANPYAASKISVEQFLSSYHKLENFDVTLLRYFNPYGPGELHNPESHAIPNFVKAALSQDPKAGQQPVIPANAGIQLDPHVHEDGKSNFQPIPLYWGGNQVRDFIYVEDLAKAHTVVLNLTGFNVFNVGTEAGVKIIDVVNHLSDILGYTLEIKDLGDRPGDVEASYASSQKLHEATGWKAEVDLKTGLQKTVDWFKSIS